MKRRDDGLEGWGFVRGCVSGEMIERKGKER